jgi:GNAT superfamily N-acetyltransferase
MGLRDRYAVTGDLRVLELTGADEQAMRDAFEVRRATQRHDRPHDPPPSWLSFQARPLWPFPGSQESSRVAYEGPTAVAWLGVYRQTHDNLDVAQIDMEVHPDHRGRGIAQALLRLLTAELCPESRTRLLFDCPKGGPGERFLRAAGARCVVADTQRRLDVALVDHEGHDELLRDAQSHAVDYDLVTWVGPTPEELRADVAALHARMSTDQPLDDLAWEPEVYDEAKVVARDEMMAAHGMRVYACAVRDRDSETAVGITTLVVFADVPEFGDQWETIVLPEHRGHRLGMLLKVSNLRHALNHERNMQEVHTWNADSNAVMLAVNVAMGFVPVREGGEWELAI